MGLFVLISGIPGVGAYARTIAVSYVPNPLLVP